jgi:hypothetical protein
MKRTWLELDSSLLGTRHQEKYLSQDNELLSFYRQLVRLEIKVKYRLQQKKRNI